MAKAAITVDDPAFGTLVWDALDGAWAAGVAIDHFASFGSDLPPIASDDDEEDAASEDENGGDGEEDALRKAISSSTGFFDLLTQTTEVRGELEKMPAEERALFERAFSNLREQAEAVDDPAIDEDKVLAEGKFLLSVVPPAKKKPPTDEQREAWTALLADIDAIAGKVMARALEVYRRQRPVRLKWWKAYDDSPARHLPDVKTTKALAKVVRPMRFRVYPGGEVGVLFDGIWERAGAFGALLREGEILALGPEKVTLEYTPKKKAAKRLDHPVFGPLRLASGIGDEWVGTLRFDAFGDFYEIANERRSKAFFGDQLPPWSPPWDFIEGEIDLTVYAEKDGTEPSEAQADVFRAFMADERKVVADVTAAVFDYYRKYYAEDAEADEADDDADTDADDEEDVDGDEDEADSEDDEEAADDSDDDFDDGDDDDEPRAKSPEDLRELMTLQSVGVVPGRKKKSAAVVLNFSCTWDDEHGMSVLWRDRKVAEVNQMSQVDA